MNFHPDAEHIEPQSEHFAYAKGVEAIKAKDAAMKENIITVNGMEVGDAIVAKEYIAITKSGKSITVLIDFLFL